MNRGTVRYGQNIKKKCNKEIVMVRISDAEYEVIKIIWKRKEATSLEIIEDLKSFKWSYNTIRTLIKRLQNKGAIQIANKIGKSYTYMSTIDENEYKNEMTKELLRKLYNSSFCQFISEYYDANQITEQDIRMLIKYIEEKNEENNK